MLGQTMTNISDAERAVQEAKDLLDRAENLLKAEQEKINRPNLVAKIKDLREGDVFALGDKRAKRSVTYYVSRDYSYGNGTYVSRPYKYSNKKEILTRVEDFVSWVEQTHPEWDTLYKGTVSF